jgi:hypothetical protein
MWTRAIVGANNKEKIEVCSFHHWEKGIFRGMLRTVFIQQVLHSIGIYHSELLDKRKNFMSIKVFWNSKTASRRHS